MDHLETVKLTRYLTSVEFTELNNATMAEGKYNTDRSVFVPGTVWEQDWVYDPTGERERRNLPVMFTRADREAILAQKQPNRHLSMFYWNDWSHRRPPLCIVCPNESQWEIDRISSNGPGWKVIGMFPSITILPSIDMPRYHGHLRNGEFSYDMHGGGPRGFKHHPAIPK